MAIELASDKAHLVIKRDGSIEPYSEEKMTKVLMWACNNNEDLVKSILQAVEIRIYNKIHISTLFDEVLDTVSNMISRLTPIYEDVLKRLYLQKQYKELWGIKRNEYPTLQKYFEEFSGPTKELKNPNFTTDELILLDKAIQPERDLLSPYLGLVVFFEKYSIQGKELLQHGFMRMAIQAYVQDPSKYKIKKIITRYNNLSLGIYTEATPKFKNSLRHKFYGASCCVHKADDNSESINAVTSDIGQYSRADGGNACDVSSWRASNSTIGLVGKSNGPIPFIKKLEAAVNAYNQNSTRPGVCAVYYQWWHADVMQMIPLMDEGGKENQRARALKFGIKLNRLFLRAIEKDENVYLFDPKVVPHLNELHGKEFDTAYGQAVKNNLYTSSIKARDIALAIAKERLETGNLYIFFIENVNENTQFTDHIHSSNLCVTGDTKILTRTYGYIPIKEVAGQQLDCWNGKEWSLTKLAKTSEASPILTVTLSNGHTIRATEYHKWYKIKQDRYGGFKGTEVVRTNELAVGDKLIKFNLEPVNHGNKQLDYAYENGFYTADGTTLKNGNHKIYLYSTKKKLLQFFTDYNSVTESKKMNIAQESRLTLNYSKEVLENKYFVPDNSYTVQSRLDWLAGYLDGDGTLLNNNGTESIQVSSTNHEFLKDLLLLLQELGINSKVLKGTEAGFKHLPNNSVESSEFLSSYWCNETKRIAIPGSELNKLLDMGYTAHRVVPTRREYNRSASQFIKIVSIEDKGEVEATYCGNEPKEHKLMFNGVLTGNCMEIFLPTIATKFSKPNIYENITTNEITTNVSNNLGLTALCNLSSINVDKWLSLTLREQHKVARDLLEASDNLIDIQSYPTPEGEIFNRNYRAIGIGQNNLAYAFASRGIKFTEPEALKLQETISKSIYTVFNEESEKLALERGTFKWFDKTKLNSPKRFATLFALPPGACQTKESEIRTENGVLSIEDILNSNKINYKDLESTGIPKWLNLTTPITIPTRKGIKTVDKLYYNGKQPTRTITFEDGNSYTFTYNHRLLLKTGEWKEVGLLTVEDEILDIN